MKKALKIVGLFIGALVLAAAVFATFVSVRGIPTYDPPQPVALNVAVTPEHVARGEKIAQMLCIQCHSGPDGRLTGKLIADAPKEFGQIYSPNITKDPTVGVGKWTDGELVHLIRTGVRRDGTYNVLMPKFPNMADADVQAVVAWLRSDAFNVQPDTRETPKNEFNFLVKMLANTVMKPLPMPQKAILVPDSTDRVAFGRYVANDMVGCFGCHSKDFKTVNDLEPEKSEGFYAGGNPMLNLEGQVIPSANLTMDPETGIGKWTEDDFVKAVKQGAAPGGRVLRYPMIPHVTLTDGEVRAIYTYLKTIPKLKNNVAPGGSEPVAMR